MTIPHKEAALALADEASDAARAIGAANTLTFEDGAILADNTDAPGFLDALPAGYDLRGRAGAGARRGRRGPGGGVGAAPGRRGRGARSGTGRRSAPRRSPAALGVSAVTASGPLEAPEVVVNCTSVGLTGEVAPFKALPLRADDLGAGSLVVDMVYRDGGTRLLEAARTRGADVVDGLEILVAQGAASFERWTGMEAPRTGDAGGRRKQLQHMNPPAQSGAAPALKKKGNGITTPSRRGGSGRVLTDVIVDLGFVERDRMDAGDRERDRAGLLARAAC